MKIFSVLICCFLIGGCSSNPSRTHRGDLLDDKVTNDRVQAGLARAGNDFKDVHASTTNGVVVLTGSVGSPELRSRAEQIVSDLHRGNQLEDKLQVRH